MEKSNITSLITSSQVFVLTQSICYVADNLLSLALTLMPCCIGQVLTRDVSRSYKVSRMMRTLMVNGAVLLPYPCDETDVV